MSLSGPSGQRQVSGASLPSNEYLQVLSGVGAGCCQLGSAPLRQKNAKEDESALHYCTSMSSSLFKMVSCLILHPFQTHQVGRVVAVFITMYKHGD